MNASVVDEGISFLDSIEDGTCADTGLEFFALHEGFSLAGYTCKGSGWLIGGLIVIFFIQFGSNLLWTKIGQLQRVALSHPAHSSKRTRVLRSMIFYMFISSTVHIISVLAIMSSNFWILITIISGNLLGAYFSYSNVHRDCDDDQQWKSFMEMMTTEHLKELRCKLSNPPTQSVQWKFYSD